MSPSEAGRQNSLRQTSSVEMLSSRRAVLAKPPQEELDKHGLIIIMKNVNYTVINRANRKETLYLLKDVTGYMQPAEMTALMGPSGSGKTTLLDILAGRKTQGEVTGDILYRGQKASKKFLRKFAGYVEQFDTLISQLTVREMLMYTAELKRSQSESKQQKEQIVTEVIRKLALKVCENITIGSALQRGISGGQAKRTNIGLALVTQPKVLFLDEPTTGLDSYTANDVMNVVKRIVVDGVTICATIHSPTQFAFDLFDSMMMLVRGEVVFFGPNNDSKIKYFESLPGVGEYEQGVNTAEWITDIVTSTDRMGIGHVFAEKYRESEMMRKVDEQIEKLEKSKGNEITQEMRDLMNVKRVTKTSFFYGLWILLKFRTLRNLRDPEYLLPRTGDKIAIGFILCTLYAGIGNDYDEGYLRNIPSINAIVFMFTALPSFSAAAYVPTIYQERTLYVRERNDGLYRSITYLVFKSIEEMLVGFVSSFFFTLTVFYIIDLQGSFVIAWQVYMCALFIGIQLAYSFAAWSPSLDVANLMMPVTGITFVFFSGISLSTQRQGESLLDSTFS
eukprot:TRINITY_DN37288_c0_g1_i5.p1 TRINITY_DN37288_c0_g1~~TRINITY_DN37288_c0_g1_i5.p1  ORF type:complete len:593 (-),score=52.46 TRINITY_DN37288_c0_g1_i5:42-1727(-)